MGSKRKVFACLGASNHSDHEREQDDFYATDPIASELLLQVEPNLNNIWECACGEGHLAKVFDKYGKLGKASDMVDRGYGEQQDFLRNLEINFNPYYQWDGDIVTNPPYRLAKDFVLQALKIVPNGKKVCMFLRLLFLEGKERKEMFKEFPPQTVYVSASRIKCALNGIFKQEESSAQAYAWFVWEKGYKGETVIKWIN
jgi:hypothetical protein